MSNKIFKIHDREKGEILMVRDESGAMKRCDENGNILSEGNTPTGKTYRTLEVEMPSTEKISPKTRKSSKRHDTRISVFATSAQDSLINDYVSWKSLNEHSRYSRSDLMMRAILGVIKRDTEFQSYLKKNL